MMHHTTLELAYILHTRTYRDTSLILDFFTKQQGIMSAIARGVRGKKNLKVGLLQPFNLLEINWFGRNELVTLKNFETIGKMHFFTGTQLICGLYLNELIIKVLHRHDPHPMLFDHYHAAIQALENHDCLEQALRVFERKILEELGYGLQLEFTADQHHAVRVNGIYQFRPSIGVIEVQMQLAKNSLPHDFFYGDELIGIHQNLFHDIKILKSAKRLFRIALASVLGNQKIQSRALL